MCEELKKLARREQVTLFMVLLGAWEVLLQRYSGQEEMLIGSPIANRNRMETEKLIGFFVNILVLRGDLRGDPTFVELLGRVRETTLGAYAHQDLPFEKLVAELQPERSLEETPLFRVMFTWHNEPALELELAGLKWEPVKEKQELSKFDLTLSVHEEEGSLPVVIEYNRDLFDETTITGMAEHLQNLLQGIVRDGEKRVSELGMLSEEERREVVEKYNQTEVEYGGEEYVHEMFAGQARRKAEAVAVECGGERVSYEELNRRANGVAQQLRQRGVRGETLVGLCMERSVEMVVGMLGVLKAGGAYVPLDPGYPQERLRYMMEDSGVEVVLSVAGVEEKVRNGKAAVVLLEKGGGSGSGEEATGEEAEGFAEAEVEAEQLAYVIYTSGSTGRPKGVMVTHGGLRNYLSWCSEAYEVEGGSGTLVHSSMAFDLTVTSLFSPLVRGQRVVLVEEGRGAEKLGEALQKERDLTFLKLTPAHLRMLGEVVPAEEIRGRVRALVIGGEALHGEDFRYWREEDGGTRIINEYGPTETVVGSCVYEVGVEEKPSGEVLIGRPIANTQMRVLDGRMNAVAKGVAGEIYIGGEGVARGYWGRARLTAERFVPNPFGRKGGERLYRTGDRGRHGSDGELEFLGRVDEQVKIRGYRVELGEIEGVMKEHPGVGEVAVVVRGEGEEQQLVGYWVKPEGGMLLRRSELRQWLQEKLPEYMVPGALVELEEMPLTANGKVNRKGLPDPAEVKGEGVRVGPRTPVEEVVAGLFSEVLKRKEMVGVEENFFELGGHSLLATQVVSRLRLAFQAEVTLPMLFEKPTAAGMAEQIEGMQREQQGLVSPPITAVPRTEKLPLSFAQQRLWFMEQLYPDTPSYNISMAVQIKGLNTSVLEQALNELVQRHESLRTRFALSADGQPVQIIEPEARLMLRQEDLSHWPEPEKEAQRILSEDRARPFHLSQLPLIRCVAARLKDDDYVLMVHLHHIIADAWSLEVLVRELQSIYEAFSKGQPSPLPPPSLQYADFARWQRQWLQGEVLERQLHYWREQLSGAPSLLPLPINHFPIGTPALYAEMQFFTIHEPVPALRTLCRKEAVTSFMLLLAALKTLLKHCTAQDDMVVGTNIANRNRIETEGMVGFFVNQLVLRTDLSGDPSFIELLDRVRKTTLNAYAHQDLPFDLLVAELRKERGHSQSPMFQVKLEVQPADSESPITLSGAGFQPSGLELLPPLRQDLHFLIREDSDSLHGSVMYNGQMFEASTITRMCREFAKLLQIIAEQPSRKLSEISQVLEAEFNADLLNKEAEIQQLTRIKMKTTRRKAVTAAGEGISA